MAQNRRFYAVALIILNVGLAIDSYGCISRALEKTRQHARGASAEFKDRARYVRYAIERCQDYVLEPGFIYEEQLLDAQRALDGLNSRPGTPLDVLQAELNIRAVLADYLSAVGGYRKSGLRVRGRGEQRRAWKHMFRAKRTALEI